MAKVASLPPDADGSQADYPRDRVPRRPRRTSRHKIGVTVHLDSEVLTELRRRTEREHLSVSAVANLLFVEALRAGVEHEHGALIEQVITRTIEQPDARLRIAVSRQGRA